MKRQYSLMILFIILFTGIVNLGYTQGIFLTNSRQRPNLEIQPLNIERHHINVSIENQLATTKIDQIFANPNNRVLEGTYIFPFHDDVAISDFVLYIDGQPVRGELLAKAEARATYEGIVRSMQDPALLEYIGTRAFKVRVFPIPANGERRIQLEYSQVIDVDSNLAKYTYPLRTDKFTNSPVGSLAVSIDIKSKHELKSIYSPSHTIAINRKDNYNANLSFEGSNVHVIRDFTCYYSISDKEFGIDLITHRDNIDEPGFFMLLISPKYKVKKTDIIEKDFIFILDRSGSMKGRKIEQAKDALRFCVNNLNDGDRFNLILFNTDVESFSKEMVPIKKERENALAFIEDIDGNGGTNINDALLTSLSEKPDPKRPRIVVFLTDGEATTGTTDTKQILNNVANVNKNESRIFVFGVGYDVNVNLLDKIAEENSGTRQYVKPKENLEVAVSTFFTKISEPVLVNLELDIDNITIKEQYPKKLPHLFRGSQLTVLGRYTGIGKAKLVLHGEVEGKKHKFSNNTKFPHEKTDHQFLPKLWAQRKVAYLVDEVRLNGEDRELIEEITRLSKKYGIVTPYTSFLVTEDMKDEQVFTRLQRGRLNETRQFGRILDYSTPIPKSAPQLPSRESKVQESVQLQSSKYQEQLAQTSEVIKVIKDKTFHRMKDVWVDSVHKSETETTKIEFGSEAYFELLKNEPELSKYLAIGKHVIVCHKNTCYEIYPPNKD
ncbi:VWA domain-containing protein [Candidatus Poribacteria bacterium]|nr:VWA domain-containing protein [Candidatus Poribacteria bacterium]